MNEKVWALMQAQLTEKFIKGLLNYAAKRVAMLQHGGIPTTSDMAEQLAWDAISDTASGKVKWDPQKCRLSTHLWTLIKTRTFKRLRRPNPVKNAQFVSDLPEDNTVETPEYHVGRTMRIKRILTTLLEMTKNEDVQLVLVAFEEGDYKKSDIIEKTGQTEEQYAKARKELRKLVKELPPELNTDD